MFVFCPSCYGKRHAAGLAHPAHPDPPVGAVARDGRRGAVPDLPETGGEFHQGTAIAFAHVATWVIAGAFLGLGENGQQELWGRQHGLGRGQVGQVC